MEKTETKIISDRELSLKEMQDIVGGMIQVAYDDGKMQIICNEEGIMRGLPINETATDIWHDKLSKFNSNPNYIPFDYLVGTVLILKDKALMR